MFSVLPGIALHSYRRRLGIGCNVSFENDFFIPYVEVHYTFSYLIFDGNLINKELTCLSRPQISEDVKYLKQLRHPSNADSFFM